MSILLPCSRLVQRCIVGRRVVATYLQLDGHDSASTWIPIKSNTIIIPSQRRLFTLPDLSKISPFGSTSSNGEEGDTYHESVMMPFSKDVLFKIVSNVDEYSTFVPYCVESKVKSSSVKQINDKKEFLADLGIGYGQFQESYTSKVTVIDGKSVQATAIPTALFKRLETNWIFTQKSPQSTQVDFTIHYSFSNPFYAAFAKTAMEKMTSKMVEAFMKRAKDQQQQQQHQT